MTKSKQPKRAAEIAKVVEDWAFDEGNSYLISFWELADNLNNRWAAPLFISAKYEHKQEYGQRWSIPHYDRCKFRRLVPRTVRAMGGILVKQGWNDFYRFPKKVIRQSRTE